MTNTQNLIALRVNTGVANNLIHDLFESSRLKVENGIQFLPGEQLPCVQQIRQRLTEALANVTRLENELDKLATYQSKHD